MEPNAAEGFNATGLSSIPLILLHHPLFHLDPQADRQFNNAKSHSSLQIRARTRLEETP
jgi:hypothetical protein